MTIGEMKEIKETRGYSFSKLSEYTGIPAVTIQKIFSGKTKNPRTATLNALERVLKGDEGLYAGKALTYETASLYSCEIIDGFREEAVNYKVKKPGEYTVEDFQALPEKCLVELIDGVLIENETPTFVHQMIVSMVHAAFFSFIKKNRGDCKVIPGQSGVQLDSDDRSMLVPDLYVICDKEKIRRFGVFGAPDYILEVLSPSTRKRDLNLKVHKYWDAGVREYWMIDPAKKVLISYDFTNEETVPTVCPLEGTAPVAIFDGKLSIDLDEIREAIEEYG